MDGADGHGCLPGSSPAQLTHQREREREMERQRDSGKAWIAAQHYPASKHLKDRNMEEAQYQPKGAQLLRNKKRNTTDLMSEHAHYKK